MNKGDVYNFVAAGCSDQEIVDNIDHTRLSENMKILSPAFRLMEREQVKHWIREVREELRG